MAMAQNQISVVKNNIANMKGIINSESVKDRMKSMLGNEAGVFLASVLDLYTGDTNLSKCDATKVMAECMKAAALKLPVAKSLGFCYVIPYGNTPNFQLGYKGYVQLAQRTGQYKYINADCVYEGEKVTYDRITGMMEITGEATSEKAVGYFAYFKLLNGFEKAVYWSREKVEAHAKKYSKAWSQPASPWHTEFDAMALKTVIKSLISKYGIMSVDFASAVAQDYGDTVEAEVAQNANGEAITLPPQEVIEADEKQQNGEPEGQMEINFEGEPSF